MSTTSASAQSVPWWKEPTKDQWFAWWAAWMGWTLDAFDFTVFLLIMLPISQEFGVPLTDVVFVLTVTLWMRLVGAVGSGWLADRVGRKIPLMISILGYSLCNFIAGFSPSFCFLFIFRALLGIFMGAEWPAGAALAMESWPIRSRGFMSGVLQGSWGIGFALSSLIYGLLLQLYRLARHAVDRRAAGAHGRLRAPLRQGARNLGRKPPAPARPEPRGTRTAAQHLQARAARQHADRVLVDGEQLRPYYSTTRCSRPICRRIWASARPWWRRPFLLFNLVGFVAMGFWGWVGDRLGRRWAMIIPAAIAVPLAPVYLLSTDFTWIAIGFVVQGAFGGALVQPIAELSVRAVPHRGAGDGKRLLLPPRRDLRWLRAVGADLLCRKLSGRASSFPMLVGTCAAAVSVVIALLISPETKGKELTADLVVT